MGKASAPGKVIITGEHSVVYGKPAIAAALNLRCFVEISDAEPGLVINAKDLNQTYKYSRDQLEMIADIENRPNLFIHHGFDNLAKAVVLCLAPETIAHSIDITSDLPIGAGLGSSAATSVAIIGAIFDHYNWSWEVEEISKRAFEAEKVAHGTPSGIDNSVSSMGGIISFESGEIKKVNLEIEGEIPIIVANSGIPRNTKELVSFVKSRRDRVPTIMELVLDLMGNLSLKIQDGLIGGNLPLVGELFDINQGLLDAIGVNHPELSRLVQLARNAGALGAKLTGAGGGGCLIALANGANAEEISSILKNEGADVYNTTISTKGVIRNG